MASTPADELRSREEQITAQKALLKERAAEIARLQQELRHSEFVLNEKIGKLHTLIDCSRQLNSTTDVQELLQSLMRMATTVMKAKDSSLLLLDEDTNELVFNVALGEKGERMQEFRVKLGQGIAGEVAATGEPIVVADVKADSRWDQSFDAQTGFETKSIMAVPIKVRENVIGVIEVLNAGFSGSLSDEDLDVFQAFSAQAAIALENARVYQVLHTAIGQVSDTLGVGVLMTDWSGKLQVISDRARELLGLSGADAITSGTLRQLAARPNLGRLIGEALETGEAQVRAIEVDGIGHLEARCVPIADPLGKRIGVIAVLRPTGSDGTS